MARAPAAPGRARVGRIVHRLGPDLAFVGSAMTQVFSRRANLVAKLAVLAIVLAVASLVAYVNSGGAFHAAVGEPVSQPIPFSHEHHVSDDGIDCRYCHLSVQTSAWAGMPSTGLCLGCHSQLFPDAAPLAPLHRSAANDRPIAWKRIHDLPEFVYFNHSVHVNNGVGCVSCHGRVDQMPLTWQVQPIQMQWCLGCHRDPLPHLRPLDAVTSMEPLTLSREERRTLATVLGIAAPAKLTDCSTCHR